MNDLVPDRLDEPWTRSAIAKQSGVVPTTLANWAARDQTPLTTVLAPNGDAMYTWRHLLDFCRANQTFTPHVTCSSRTASASAPDPSSRLPLPTSAGVTGATRSRSASTGAASGDDVTLRIALQDLKTQVDEHAAVVAAAVKLAEHAACVQQTLATSMAQLVAVIAAAPRADG